MKILTISRNKLEITSAQLRRPNLTIGRSPVCDINLRAPGVAPIHFLIEWIGSGEFDVDQGAWSIVDISSTIATVPDGVGTPEYAEGVVLSENPVHIADLTFAILEDKLSSAEEIGGQILGSFRTPASYKQGELLELVQVRVDSGAIEEVRHVAVPQKARRDIPLRDFKEFKIEWPGNGEALLKLLLEEMPGSEIFRRGHKIEAKDAPTLRPHEILQVRWHGRDFFLRFVEELAVPPIPIEFFGDPFLKRIAMVVLGIGLLILLLASLYRIKEEDLPPPRIAKIEVPSTARPVQEAPVETPPETPPKAPETKEEQPEVKEKAEQPKSEQPKMEEPAVQKQVVKTPDKSTKAAKAAAPRQATPHEAPKAGLNAPAKVTDVNQVGILGALSKASGKGRGVKADKIIADTVVTDSITGRDQSKIVLRNPPSGALGDTSSGAPSGGESKLGSASTTLTGAGKYDPSSVGPIARKGGTSGANVGAALSGEGSGLGKGAEIGSIDGGDFSVEGGGLDRETVRRVIASFRGQIRTCYERALLTNPRLEGRLVYSWRITAEGEVLSAETSKATIESPQLKSCVLEVIRRMNFPKSPNGKSTRVIYPFVFQGKK